MAALLWSDWSYAQDSDIVEPATGQEEIVDTLQPQPQNKNMADISDALLNDARAFHARCKANGTLIQQYDCDCLAAHYLQKRKALGPVVLESDIFTEIRGQCRNYKQFAGDGYEYCMSDLMVKNMNIMIQPYCECVGREAGKIMKSYNAAGLSRTIRRNMIFTAMSTCRTNMNVTNDATVPGN